MWWLAQQPATGPELGEWLNYGAVGLMIVAILLGWLWAKPAVDRIIKENEALRRRVDRYEDEILTEIRKLREELRDWRDGRPSP